MFKRLKFAGLVFGVGFALAALYGVVGPRMHGFALHGSVVISDGIWNAAGAQQGYSIPAGVNSGATFKDWMNKMLYSNSAYLTPGSTYNSYGAAFLLETMLHGQVNYNADDPLVWQARADFNTWAGYIDQYETAGRISWFLSSTLPTGSLNSLHVCSEGSGGYCWDRAVYQNNNYNNGGWDAHRFQFYNISSPEPSTLMVFTNPDGTTFQIRRECGNVIGSASPLRNIGWNLDGQELANKTSIYANETVNFTSQIRNNGPATAYSFFDVKYCYDTCSGGYNQTYTSNLDVNLQPNGAWKTVDTWPFTPPANTTHTKICVLLHFSDTTGPYTPWEDSPPVCVTIIPLVASCGSVVVNPTLLGSTDSYSVTGVVNVNGGQAGAQAVNGGSNFFIKVTGPAPSSATVFDDQNVTPVTVGGSVATSGLGTLTATHNAGPTNNAGTYTITYGITGSVAPKTCTSTFDVALRPYFTTSGGDLMTGSGFGDSCAASEVSAYIKSWNTGTSSAPNYYGGGGEIGVWASGAITNFVSGMGLAGGAASGSGYGLSFANTSNVSGGGYGGNFGTGAIPCMYDYVGNRPAGTTTLSSPVTTFAGIGSGDYAADSGLTIGPGGASDLTVGQTAGKGKQITIYVKGDLYIRNNIKYTYGTIAEIPRLNVYVSGNIYIDPNVSELHGVFVAQKKPDNTGGILNTCNPGTVTASQSYATCNKQLKIVGAVATDAAIRLTRTYGNLANTSGATDEPAEIFQYSPELWMANGGNSSFKYQSYTGLPPVL